MNHSNKEISARYQRAFQLEAGGRGITPQGMGKYTLNTTVYPHWIENSCCFWYERDTTTGKTYQLVDAQTQTNDSAFNHVSLARALSSHSGETVDAGSLPISQVTITVVPHQVKFTAFDRRWCFDEGSQSLNIIDGYPIDWKLSPDRKKAVFVRDHNLWLRDLVKDIEQPLTQDGEACYAYAATPTVYGRQERETVEAIWSADSQRLFTLVRDTRQVAIGPPLVQHVPDDGSVRPRVLNPERRVGMPGDKHIEVYRFLAIDITSGAIQNADYRGCPVFMPPYVGFFSGIRGWWAADNRHGYFIDLARDGRTGRLVEFDTDSGETRVIIEETEAARFTFIPLTHFATLIVPLPSTQEVIWYSERSGWAHLYLYDLNTGSLKHPITEGEWVVRTVLHYDAERREVWIQCGGRIAEHNPYYCDICRVNIDTGELTPVASSDHEYTVCDGRGRAAYRLSLGGSSALGVSANGRYVVTTRSRVDEMPVSLLLDRDGQTLLTLEQGEVPALPTNWQWPEPVMLKAADGVTDIYAVVCRPSDFDPALSYPVVDCSWGDFIPVGSFTNDLANSMFYLTLSAVAELGFIAVMVIGRGTAMRSKSFYDDKAHSLLFSYHIDDHIAALQQLAERYPYMDLTRVGAASHSSSVAPIVGLLDYPDFYKVGVCTNPFSDLSLLGEFYGDHTAAGAPEGLRIEQEVGRLQGKLLLIHGMLDDCTPVASTFRLVEALQKANKDFDMLLLPNLWHGRSHYAIRRAYDYLVEHLQESIPQ